MTIKLAGVEEKVKNAYQNTTGQSPVAATRTYIQGSALTIPELLSVGSRFLWRFNVSQAGGGTATGTIDIAVGSAGTVADTARVSFTKPAGTAVADEALVEVSAVVVSVGPTGVILGEIQAEHNLATTGFMAQQIFLAKVASAGFPNDGSGQPTPGSPMVVGLCYTSGAADVPNINWVTAEYIKP